jgi:hypothetical protein
VLELRDTPAGLEYVRVVGPFRTHADAERWVREQSEELRRIIVPNSAAT